MVKVPFECSDCFVDCCQELDANNYSYIGRTSLRYNVKCFIDNGKVLDWFKSYQVNYEPRRIGNWEIGKFSVDELDAFRFNIGEIDPGLFIVPGDYTRLVWHDNSDKEKFPLGQTVMSDSPAEISDHLEFIDRAYGRVLINGLGLGMVATALLREEKNGCIEHIDIVELNPEVIELVGHYFKDNPKVTIHCADAFEIKWPRGTYWHCAWHDIWYTIDPSDLEQQNRLHQKYKHRVKWQDSWKRKWLQKFAAWERRNNFIPNEDGIYTKDGKPLGQAALNEFVDEVEYA